MNGLDYTSYFTLSDFKYYYRNGLIPKPNYFGLLTFDAPPRRKPAYYAFQTLCNLFDDDTVLSDEYKVELNPFPYLESERFSFQEMRIHLKQAKFMRREYPLYVFWMPSNLFSPDSGEKEIMIRLWVPKGNKQLKKPVLIDPVTQEIFEPEIYDDPFFKKFPAARTMDLIHVPVRDYPLIVTDLSVC